MEENKVNVNTAAQSSSSSAADDPRSGDKIVTREGATLKGKDFDYNITRDRKFCKLMVKVLGPFVRHKFKAQYFGLENVPKEGKLIIACNHRSYFDPFLLCAGKTRSIHYMAKLELFSVNPAVSWFLRHCNAFPIKRGQHDMDAMNYAHRVVNEGKVLGIFPEGTRSIEGERLRPKLGVARIANATHADVLPASIYYVGDKCGENGPTTIRFGEVIPYEDLKMSDNADKEELINAATYIMEKIGDLLDKEHSAD